MDDGGYITVTDSSLHSPTGSIGYVPVLGYQLPATSYCMYVLAYWLL
jgi:hypothetical protein